MKFKMLTIAAALISAVSFGAPAHAAAVSTPTESNAAAVSTQTEDFVRNASVGNLFEIESSKVALNKSSSNDVKNFAQTMVNDHTTVGDNLKKTLSASNTGIKAAEALDVEHQKMLDDLKATPSATFDRAYVQAQSSAHDSAVTLFMDYADNGDNSDLQKFASATLPTLQKHQEMLRTLSQTYLSSR